MKKREEEAKRWINQAKEDLEAVKYNHIGKKYFVSIYTNLPRASILYFPKTSSP
ncbi:MAG: hypothetical protein H5U37_05230 [Caldisericia bacterium]|nr:hypothetical protein [Caldisericia bacterium]